MHKTVAQDVKGSRTRAPPGWRRGSQLAPPCRGAGWHGDFCLGPPAGRGGSSCLLGFWRIFPLAALAFHARIFHAVVPAVSARLLQAMEP